MKPHSDQILRIRQLSNALYGNDDTVFNKYGKPASREHASDMLRALDKARTGSNINELDLEPTPNTTRSQTGKVCSRCKTAKPSSEYHKNRTTKDGLNTWCKQCVSVHRKNTAATKKPKRPKKSKSLPEAKPVPQNGDVDAAVEALRDALRGEVKPVLALIDTLEEFLTLRRPE